MNIIGDLLQMLLGLGLICLGVYMLILTWGPKRDEAAAPVDAAPVDAAPVDVPANIIEPFEFEAADYAEPATTPNE